MSTNFCSQFLKQPAASFSVNSLLASGMEEQYGDMTVSTTTEPLPTSTASIMEPKPDQPLAELDEVELWSRFNRLTNEMIVTKNGRFVAILVPSVFLFSKTCTLSPKVGIRN